MNYKRKEGWFCNLLNTWCDFDIDEIPLCDDCPVEEKYGKNYKENV
jgi:hypothetical protein